MYSAKVSKTILSGQHNLNVARIDRKNVDKTRYFLINCSLNVRNFSFNNTSNELKKIKSRFRNILQPGFFDAIKGNIFSLQRSIKEDSCNLLRNWNNTIKFKFNERMQKSQRVLRLCSKLYKENNFKDFVGKMKKQISNKENEFFYTLVGIAAYNWETKRITDKEITNRYSEFEYIKKLRDATVMCESCNKNILIEHKRDDTSYCECIRNKNSTYEGWEPYSENPDFIVWRRLHFEDIYEYKVVGYYPDVSPEDFLSVQIDNNYRKIWDKSAVRLEVVESDITDLTNEIIYWEFLWPTGFANRDYVFNRRYAIDTAEKKMVIANRSTEHPAHPVYTKKKRVEDYWSYFVIEPETRFDEPGTFFSLTYFDNPGINIPKYLSSWVVSKEMPTFLKRLRAAAKDYKAYCDQNNLKKYTLHYDTIKKGPKAKESEPRDEKPVKLSNERIGNSIETEIVLTSPMDKSTFPNTYPALFRSFNVHNILF